MMDDTHGAGQTSHEHTVICLYQTHCQSFTGSHVYNSTLGVFLGDHIYVLLTYMCKAMSSNKTVLLLSVINLYLQNALTSL